MIDEEKNEIKTKQDYWVVKGNALIQQSRFSLSLIEQKTVAYICSMIKPATVETRSKICPDSPWQLDYTFDIQTYCKICRIDWDNGGNYAYIKKTLQQLRNKSMWLSMSDGSEILVGWLAKARTNKKSGVVTVRIDEDLAPYLFDLKKRFTQYQLFNILGMSSAFSIRLYELLKSYAFQKSVLFDIDELKNLLMVQDVKSYHRFPDFRRYVIEIAMREINEMTDLQISYETMTKGRKVIKIKFVLSTKSPIEQVMAKKATQLRLEGID